MDVIKPDIWETNGRFYCLFNTKSEQETTTRHAPYREDDGIEDHSCDDDDIDIVEEGGV